MNVQAVSAQVRCKTLYIRWFICQMTTVSWVCGLIAQSVGYVNSKIKYVE